ncbi:MAG: MBL fold metallo-hydrolase [Chloroflexota bacterium]
MLVELAKLTVLGASPAWTNPGGAGSGYLLRLGETAIQLEAGSGTLGRLRKMLPVEQLTAIIISHVHADHFLDLVPMCYGLRYGDLRGGVPLRVFVPPGCVEFLSNFARALNGEPDFFSNTFDLAEYPTDSPFVVGGLTFRAAQVQHYISSYSLRCDVGRGFVFSGDSGPCEELVNAARGAGVLLCEAALTDLANDAPDPKQRGHLTPAEAAEMAERAGVRRLLLTHFRTDIQNYNTVAAQARAHFSGRVTLVRESRTYSL